MAYTNEWDCDVSFTMPSSNVTTSCVGGTADTTAPTATLTQATGSSVTATITDTNDITAYYFGTTSYSSGSDVPTDSWVSSTSKSLSLSITSSSTYYFYVKDEFNNISSQYSITPTYDVTPPSIAVSVTNGTTAADSHTATITLSDTSGFSSTSDNVIYKWSTSTISSCPTSTDGWTSLAITTSGTSGSATATITNSVGSGNGKIYVCPYPSSSYYPTDKWGNEATPSNTSPVSANLYLTTSSTFNITSTCTNCQSIDSKTGVAAGSSATITAISNIGYQNMQNGSSVDYDFDSCTITNDNTGATISYNYTNNYVSLEDSGNQEGRYQEEVDVTFTMPSSNVTVTCSFTRTAETGM